MKIQLKQTLTSTIFGPSAYEANVELYEKKRLIQSFSASPNVAMQTIDRHIENHAPHRSLRSRARLWLDVNEEFGPLVLPKALRAQVRSLLNKKHPRINDRLSSQRMGAWMQACGVPLPTPYVKNVLSLGALGLLLDYSEITPAPLGSAGSLVTFYFGTILSNASQPEFTYGISGEDYKLDICKKRSF